MDELGQRDGGPDKAVREDIRASLRRICILLHQHTGHDFSRYKESTLVRRIQWRLHARRAASLADYISALERDPAEAGVLFKDLLISVTSFFRDAEVFDLLARQVIPAFCENREPDSAIRIWVPGCASGEEAYSIAMLVEEHLCESGKAWPVQVFATDVDDEAVRAARSGRYADEAVAHVSPQRLERFFTREGTSWHAGKSLRDKCIFSVHNLIQDPPFAGLDLIACRNLLIYLEADLQKKLVPLFHYALRPGGCLLLGPSEGLAAHPELFITLDKKWRLFQRCEGVVRPFVEFPLIPPPAALSPALPAAQAKPPAAPPQAFGPAFERMILEEYAPPCAVVNPQGDILYVAGRTGPYFQPPAGAFSSNLIALVPGGLKMALRSALHSASRTHRKAVRKDVAVEADGRVRQLRLTVRPLPGASAATELYAVIWQETGVPREPDAEGTDASDTSPHEPVIQQLEIDLRATREELQAAIEETESANEELKAANEQLIAANEELQSANEELRASEEQRRHSEHRYGALFNGMEEGVALHRLIHDARGEAVDYELLDVNPACEAILGFSRAQAAGKRATALYGTPDAPYLAEYARVVQTGTPCRFETYFAPLDQHFLISCVSPAPGIFATIFRDITGQRQAEEVLRRFELLVQQSRDIILFIRRDDGRILEANAAATAAYGRSRQELLGMTIHDLRADETESLTIDQIARADAHGLLFESVHRRRDGSTFPVEVSSRGATAGGARTLISVIRDITERKRAEQTSRATIELLSLCNNAGCLRDLMRDLTGFFQRFTDCEAVGVRLQEGEDFPYYETRGLPSEFVLAESQLCARSPSGELVRDSAGHPILECMCGNVLCGRFDRTAPFFSECGSFWTNSTSGLLASTTEADRQSRTRNRCNGEGYESVALVPIRISGQTAGLWQFNSRQTGRFSPERIEMLEQLADYVGIAMAKLRAEEALRESEQRLRLALESGQMGLWEWDVRTNRSVWNDQEYALLALPPGDGRVPTGLFLKHVHPGDAPRVDRAIADALREGASFQEEFRVIRADGELRWLAAIARVLRDANGQPLRMLGVNYDITERKRAEEAVLAHQAEIAHLSRVASVGEMASSIAHELNQPLTAILCYAEACLNAARSSTGLPARTLEHLHEISNEANRAAGIVNRVRNYVRKEPPARQPRDINQIVREAADLVRHNMQRAGVAVRLLLADGLAPVLVDSIGIQQVLINLLQNALDAMQQVSRGDRHIAVQTLASESGIQVSVADTGVAASPEVIGRIFTSFFTTRPDGLGLGLSICRTIIESHGGRISAAANPGRGMTFTFTLPAGSAD